MHSKSHIIDIDHFVPKSLGGPGNIEENLVPVGLSLNRYKSNQVPSGLFNYAYLVSEDFRLRCSKIEIEQNKYYKDAKSKGMAKIITAKINMKEELNEIRNIYREIKKFHNQNL